MIDEVCRELNNFFDYERVIGDIHISDGNLVGISIAEGQYYRIVGSVFNDGIHIAGADQLKDEFFNGAVWKMAVPPTFLKLVDEIEAWSEKNLTADSAAMSPFTSESFGGYSYTKAAGSEGSSGVSWQDTFKTRLNVWRKPRCRY